MENPICEPFKKDIVATLKTILSSSKKKACSSHFLIVHLQGNRRLVERSRYLRLSGSPCDLKMGEARFGHCHFRPA
ncbi:MAG: hypothetical protein D6732_06290 [Methanobacteriota archaeon]|nr:MAG: hypothetical protein D6732_06290 [Euryarchaeota archaeon]